MRVRTPSSAVDDLLDRLRRPISCLTDQPLLATGRRVDPRPQFISFMPLTQPVLLRLTSGAAINLSIRYGYEIVETSDSWRKFETRNSSYWFEVKDTIDREILVFHWHPIGASPVTFPHLHLSSRVGPLALNEQVDILPSDMHIPTGLISMTDIVRMLIVEFGVEPRRSDWEAILDLG